MKSSITFQISALVLLILFSAHAGEFWVTTTGTDGTGTGTASDPYVRSTAGSFDALINGTSAKSAIHLMPGTFSTGGNVKIPAGCKLRGAGIDVTIVKVADNYNFASSYGGVSPTSIGQGYDVFWSQGDGTEVSDMT